MKELTCKNCLNGGGDESSYSKDSTIKLQQGDTTDIALVLSKPLGGLDIKVGFYTLLGKPLWEATLSDGGIAMVDDTHFTVHLSHADTRRLSGACTLRACIYASDLGMVNAGENAIPVEWTPEPVNRNLKGGERP